MATNGTLSAAEREFISAVRFGVLATIGHDGTPQQTVMWYDVRGDQIMMNTTADRIKRGNIQRDPRVSICIEEGYKYVTLRGVVAEIIDEPEAALNDILSLAVRYNPGTTPADHTQFLGQARQTLLIRIDRVLSNGPGG